MLNIPKPSYLSLASLKNAVYTIADYISNNLLSTFDVFISGEQTILVHESWARSIQYPAPTVAGGTTRAGAWSPDGLMYACGTGTTPFTAIYRRSNNIFTKIASPAALAGIANGRSSWSPDGRFWATAHSITPFITIFEVEGDTFTKLANPSVIPPTTGNGVQFSPDGKFLVVSYGTSPSGNIIYSVNGKSFDAINAPITPAPVQAAFIAFSPDSSKMVLTYSVSPYFEVYAISGKTFTLLTGQPPSGLSATYIPVFSNNGQFLALISDSAISIHTVSANAISDPITYLYLPPNARWGSWNYDDSLFVVSSFGDDRGDYITGYRREGSTFTRAESFDGQPTNFSEGSFFSPDGKFLMSHNSTGLVVNMNTYTPDIVGKTPKVVKNISYHNK